MIINVVPAVVPVLPVAVVVAGFAPPVLAGGPLGWATVLGGWFADLPAHLAWLWGAAGALWWPWAPIAALAAVAFAVAAGRARRAVWRRVAAGGYWVQVTPPRVVDAARWGLVWRRLDGLAAAARGRWWRLARPPLAFEVYRRGRVVTAGLWLPGWVPYGAVVAEVARAWPGSTVDRVDPPALPGDRSAVAGLRLAVDSLHPETRWLVDDPRPRPASRPGSADPVLDGLWSALAEPGGPVLVQVLIRPATRRRLAWLAGAGRHPVGPRRTRWQHVAGGLVWLLLGVLRAVVAAAEFLVAKGTPRSSTRVTAREVAPDVADREAMAEARAKLADRPHLLVTVRVGAAGDRRGRARAAARSVAAGYGEASRWLRPARLARAGAALRLRRARSSEWLLLSANELGVLAHLPPDPALYRFVVAALHHAAPVGTPHPVTERPTATWPGWNRNRWTTTPPANNDTDESAGSANGPAARAVPHTAGDWNDHDDYLSNDEGEQ